MRRFGPDRRPSNTLAQAAEYCLQVPANRLGHVSHGGPFTAPVLKMIQEFISLTVFGFVSVRLPRRAPHCSIRAPGRQLPPRTLTGCPQTLVLKEKLRWADGVAFLLILCGACRRRPALSVSLRPAISRRPAINRRVPRHAPA